MTNVGTVSYYLFRFRETTLHVLVQAIRIALGEDVALEARERNELELLWRDFAKAPEADEYRPVCAVHHIEMIQMQGKHGPFWSCHQRLADGRFCSYKPPVA